LLPKALRDEVGINEGDTVTVEIGIDEGKMCIKRIVKVNEAALKKTLEENRHRIRKRQPGSGLKPGELAGTHLGEEFEWDESFRGCKSACLH